ncbi:MAG TPA: hypothetical protein VKX46_10245 [Ktedonobacteraceae bacterium]|nr:hypothetical protein [Ktedonobacteraceae bacterium]
MGISLPGPAHAISFAATPSSRSREIAAWGAEQVWQKYGACMNLIGKRVTYTAMLVYNATEEYENILQPIVT